MLLSKTFCRPARLSRDSWAISAEARVSGVIRGATAISWAWARVSLSSSELATSESRENCSVEMVSLICCLITVSTRKEVAPIMQRKSRETARVSRVLMV
ncbi:MAG: hypothetical protein ACD_74C00247G0004, partial [uncultured bacterium]